MSEKVAKMLKWNRWKTFRKPVKLLFKTTLKPPLHSTLCIQEIFRLPLSHYISCSLQCVGGKMCHVSRIPNYKWFCWRRGRRKEYLFTLSFPFPFINLWATEGDQTLSQKVASPSFLATHTFPLSAVAVYAACWTGACLCFCVPWHPTQPWSIRGWQMGWWHRTHLQALFRMWGVGSTGRDGGSTEWQSLRMITHCRAERLEASWSNCLCEPPF